MDKPVREKRIYLRDLQHIKRVVRGFVISNLMATLRGLCVQFREKLPSDCSLQPSGNIFGRKIPMSCSLKQQRKEKGGRRKGLLVDSWHMTKCQEDHRDIKFLYLFKKKGCEKYSWNCFLQSHVLSCDNKLIMMIRSFWIWVWLNGDEVKSSLRAAEMLPAVFLPTVEFTMGQGCETRGWGPIRGEMEVQLTNERPGLWRL